MIDYVMFWVVFVVFGSVVTFAAIILDQYVWDAVLGNGP